MKIWEMYATSLMYVLLCSRFLENDVADLAVDAYLSPASLWRKNIIHSSWVMMVDGPLENFSRCWMLFSAVIRNLVCLYKMVTYKKGGGGIEKGNRQNGCCCSTFHCLKVFVQVRVDTEMIWQIIPIMKEIVISRNVFLSQNTKIS